MLELERRREDHPFLIGRDLGDGDQAVASILGLIRDLLGVGAALVTRVSLGSWRASHVDDAVFGFVPGDTLPLGETFCRLARMIHEGG